MRSFIMVSTLFLCMSLTEIGRAIVIAKNLDPKLIQVVKGSDAEFLGGLFLFMLCLGIIMDIVEWIFKLNGK